MTVVELSVSHSHTVLLKLNLRNFFLKSTSVFPRLASFPWWDKESEAKKGYKSFPSGMNVSPTPQKPFAPAQVSYSVLCVDDAYEINHMWTADMKSNEEWSSQLWSQFLQFRKEAWKIQDFNGAWTRDLAIPVRRSTNWATKPLKEMWVDASTHISFTGTYEPKIDLLPTSVAS